MQFSALPVNVQWKILTALRGPDRGNCRYMKELFTARIRYWAHALGLPRDVGAVIREYGLDALIVARAEEEAAEWLREDVNGYGHWSTHMYLALHALQDYCKDREIHTLRKLIWAKPGDGRWVDIYTQATQGKRIGEEE